ncbi:hypothetical protein FS837_008544, partial [Tulasnella sp. UAMH 9824]
MFGNLFTSRAVPTAPTAPAEHAPSEKTRNQEGRNASMLSRTLDKLKLTLTGCRSDDKGMQLQNETITTMVTPIQASTPTTRDLPNQLQDRDRRHTMPQSPLADAHPHPPTQVRERDPLRLVRVPENAPQALSPTFEKTGDFNLDRSLASAAAQQLQVEVARPPKVDAVSNKPSIGRAVAPGHAGQERRIVRDERSRSWDWRFKSEMARQRYSATEEDLEKLADDADVNEPPESLLQFWKKSTTHKDRRLSWDPTWEPEMHQLRHSVTSEDLRQLDIIRRKTPWLQPHPPKSSKAKRTF